MKIVEIKLPMNIILFLFEVTGNYGIEVANNAVYTGDKLYLGLSWNKYFP